MACSTCSSSPCSCGTATSVNLNNASNVNICCRRGDTFKLEANIKDANGDALDLTLYTYKMEVREYDNGPIVIPSTDVTITGSAAGVLLIVIAAADMNVDAGTYVYGLQTTLIADSTIETWLYGKFEVVQDIVQ